MKTAKHLTIRPAPRFHVFQVSSQCSDPGSPIARLDAPSSRKTSESHVAAAVPRKFPKNMRFNRMNTAVSCGHVPARDSRTLKIRDLASACLVDLSMPWFPITVRARGMYTAVPASARLVASRCVEDDFADVIPRCLL